MATILVIREAIYRPRYSRRKLELAKKMCANPSSSTSPYYREVQLSETKFPRKRRARNFSLSKRPAREQYRPDLILGSLVTLHRWALGASCRAAPHTDSIKRRAGACVDDIARRLHALSFRSCARAGALAFPLFAEADERSGTRSALARRRRHSVVGRG